MLRAFGLNYFFKALMKFLNTPLYFLLIVAYSFYQPLSLHCSSLKLSISTVVRAKTFF
jgi:hypothetical protein